MSNYQKMTGRTLPFETLMLPLQYASSYQEQYYVTLFVQVGAELASSLNKKVYEVTVLDIIGRSPLPELATLKGRKVCLYCPYEDTAGFIQDMRQLLTLQQHPIQNAEAKKYLLNIIGENGILDTVYDAKKSLALFQQSLQSMFGFEYVETFTSEILAYNKLSQTPFLICDFLPLSIYQAFAMSDPATIFKHIYQMLFAVISFAQEGIYFRELCPEQFRMSQNRQVRLLVPTYFTGNIPYDENRYSYFLKRTIPEYLPHPITWFLRNQQHPQVLRYFEKFPEGVCIGMLERTIRRILLPQYMMDKYENPAILHSTFANRLENTITQQEQEDLELFGAQVPVIPLPHHFQYYRQAIFTLLKDYNLNVEISAKLANALTILRQFSYPIMDTNEVRTSYTYNNHPITLNQLLKVIENLLEMNLQKTMGPVPNEDANTSFGDTKRLVMPSSFAAKRSTVTSNSDPNTSFGDTKRLVMPPSFAAKRSAVTSTGFKIQSSDSNAETRSYLRSNTVPPYTGDKVPSFPFIPPQNQSNPPTMMGMPPNPPTMIGMPPNVIPNIPKSNTSTPSPMGSGTTNPIVPGAANVSATLIPNTTNNNFPSTPPPQPAQSNFGLPTVIPSSKTTPLTTSQPNDNPQDRMTLARRISKIPITERLRIPSNKTSDYSNGIPSAGQDRTYSHVAREIQVTITKKLEAIQELLNEDIRLSEKFRQRLQSLLATGAVAAGLEDFFTQVNQFLKSQEVEFDLMRVVQARVTDDTAKQLSMYVPNNLQAIVASWGVNWVRRCRKILSKSLIRIIKSRFLLEADKITDINKVLPTPEQDILEFIIKYDTKYILHNKNELANQVIVEIDQTEQK